MPFGLTQAPAYFQELMTGSLKDFDFAIAYLDDIIIFSTTVTHHNAFLTLKESIIQAPILLYQNPNKLYIVYTDASDDACRAQLS